MRFIVAALGGLEGWDALAVPEWSRRSGSVSRRRGGQTGGVFPWSFLFLRAFARARTIIPLVWRLRAGGGEAPSHPVARGWRLGKTSREKPCPGSFLKRRQLRLTGRRGAGAGRRPPPTLAGSASSRPGARSCLSPPSSTVGATLSSQGAGRGWGWGVRCLGPSAGRRGEPGARRLATLRTGVGTHLPKGAWRGGHLPGKGALRKRLGVGGTDRKPPSLPGRDSDF